MCRSPLQPSVRKTHCSGRKHKENVKDYYQKWMEEQAQSLIDKTSMWLIIIDHFKTSDPPNLIVSEIVIPRYGNQWHNVCGDPLCLLGAYFPNGLNVNRLLSFDFISGCVPTGKDSSDTFPRRPSPRYVNSV